MQNKSEPWPEAVFRWSNTFEMRRSEILAANSMSTILNDWPLLLHAEVKELVIKWNKY